MVLISTSGTKSRGTKRALTVAAVLVGLLPAGCGASDEEAGQAAGGPGRTVHVDLESYEDLDPFNKSGGKATLEAIDGGRTRVVVELSKPLAHGRVVIRRSSSCLEVGTAVIAGLRAIVDGRSETELTISLDRLTSQDSSLWVHENEDEEQFYACGEIGRTPPPAIMPARKAAEIVACYAPTGSYGFEQGYCSRIEKLERVGDAAWRVQLRRPPVYCVRMDLGDYDGDHPVEGVGSIGVVRCPASAYPEEPEPDLRLRLREPFSGRRMGVVSLTALGPGRTRVLIEADAETAWIRRGACSNTPGAREAETSLEGFYSYRSVTTLPVGLESLTGRPHALEIVGEIMVGGLPTGCVNLRRP